MMDAFPVDAHQLKQVRQRPGAKMRSRDTDVVALTGGLGNNLYQFALAYYLQTLGRNVQIDVSGVPRRTLHGPQQIVASMLDVQVSLSSRLLPNPLGQLGRTARATRSVLGPSRVVVDRTAAGYKHLGTSEKPAWWFGYWQQLGLAQPLARQLTTHLDLLDQPRRRVGMHVRRGDMVGLTTETSSSYYRASSQRIADDPSNPAELIHVWTDDPGWVAAHLDLALPFRIVLDSGPLDAIIGMAMCKSLVVPRSTLSIWAALIGEHIELENVYFPADAPDERAGASVEIPQHWHRI